MKKILYDLRTLNYGLIHQKNNSLDREFLSTRPCFSFFCYLFLIRTCNSLISERIMVLLMKNLNSCESSLVHWFREQKSLFLGLKWRSEYNDSFHTLEGAVGLMELSSGVWFTSLIKYFECGRL